MSAPIACRWSGDSFIPLSRHHNEVNARFVIGQVYSLDEIQSRSSASHAHFFACVTDAWHNLKDEMAERFATPEHLRKYCLIKAGFHDERTVVCASKAEAHRIAAFVRPMDEYAVVTVSGAVVKVYTAQSQSMRAMGKERFQDSKEKVFDVLETMLGVAPGELRERGSEGSMIPIDDGMGVSG
jgi:hypothetical protein